MAPNRRDRRWSKWWSDGSSDGDGSASNSRSGNKRWPPRNAQTGGGGAWAETTCQSCGKGKVFNRLIQQTPCCSICGARFVLQPRGGRHRKDQEEGPTDAAAAAPPGPILALYERHLASGDGETAAVLLEQWPALAGKPKAEPEAQANAKMAVDEEGGGATLTRKQEETAVQKAHQKLRRARIEEEKQLAEWEKAEAYLETVRVKVGEAVVDREKAFNDYHAAVARQAEAHNRPFFASPPPLGNAGETAEPLQTEVYAAASPELGRAASEANTKVASLRSEIRAVIEAVEAQGREFEAQQAARGQSQQTTAADADDGRGSGTGPPGGDNSPQAATKPGAGGQEKVPVRRAGGRSKADIEACKKLALAAKKALKESGALASDDGSAGAVGDSRLSS